jgi:hypothetical protein
MPLLDLVHTAQGLVYCPPPGKSDVSEFTEEEVYEAAMSQILKDPTIVYGLVMCCKSYAPIKILLKNSLRRYVQKYSTAQ